jgi:subtilisin family serine protease
LRVPCASSQGPTGDGRMKPNVVAPGTWVRSARAGTADQYQDRVGTSMAAPHVAGLAATLMQHYPEFQWRPYLLRAHLMASALPHDNLTTPGNNDAGGRNDYGLGRALTTYWG